MMKNLILTIAVTVLGSHIVQAAPTSGKISCQFDTIKIEGNFSHNGLTLTKAGIFQVKDLCDNNVRGEHWSGIAGEAWSRPDGVTEFDIELNCGEEHSVPSQSLNIPAKLSLGLNPAFLQTAQLNSQGRPVFKRYRGTCIYKI